MRTFTIAAALLFLAGCQETPQPAAGPVQTPPAVAPAPPAPAPGEAAPSPPAPPKVRKNPLPTDQEEFKAAMMKSTREQVLEKYGPPDELGDWGATVGWDGPVSIYHGTFTTADGKQAAKARLYFSRNVVASVDFTNQ